MDFIEWNFSDKVKQRRFVSKTSLWHEILRRSKKQVVVKFAK